MQMHFIELIKPGLNIDFIRWRRVAVVASLVVNVIVLFGATVYPGLNYGVDFAGGTEMEIKFAKPVDVAALRKEIEAAGFASPTVQTYGPAEENAFLVRVERVASLSKEKAEALHQQIATKFSAQSLSKFGFDPEVGDQVDLVFKDPVDPAALRAAIEAEGVQVKEGETGLRIPPVREGMGHEYVILAKGPGDKIGAALKAKFGEQDVDVRRTEYVGPQVGRQLRIDGIKAVLYAIGMILVYVGLRFDFRFAPGVVIALVHDAIITLGYFVFSRREFNLVSITVILTVVGYSVNDTIVVYDRIRENGHRFKGKPMRELINLSINEMLGRTILTSGATALSLVGLLIYGVGTIFDFSAAMAIGIISGTYSTWYIAAPTTIWIEEISQDHEQRQRLNGKARLSPVERSGKQESSVPAARG